MKMIFSAKVRTVKVISQERFLYFLFFSGLFLLVLSGWDCAPIRIQQHSKSDDDMFVVVYLPALSTVIEKFLAFENTFFRGFNMKVVLLIFIFFI